MCRIGFGFVFACLVHLSCVVTCATAQEPVNRLLSDFATCDFDQPVVIETQSKQGKITGQFPQGWHDNSSWAPVYYASSREQDDAGHFWRIQIPTAQAERIQLMHELPSLEGQDYRYELVLKARGNQYLEIGVRRRGAPYEFFWDTRQVLDEQWHEYRWKFQLKHKLDAKDIGLWLNVTGSPAQVDIRQIKLIEYTPQMMLDMAKVKYPGDGPKNLLRQSRLPLGLQTGWSLNRELDDQGDVQIDSISDSTSPTGHDVLHIKSREKKMLLRGEPMFIHRTWLDHVASVYVKGNGRIQFSVNNENYYLGNREIAIDPSMGWQRVVIPFKPMVSDYPTCLMFQGKGEFEIDGLMVHSGNTPTDYVSQLPVEVALAPGAGEIAPFTNTHFSGEKPQFRYAVTGLPANVNANLNLLLTNVYGIEHRMSVPLSDTSKWAGTLAYDVFADQPYGSVRIEALVTDQDSKPISTANELVMHHLRRPHYWMKDAPNSAFGTHTLATRRHIQMAKAIGINWTRLHDAGTEYIGWYHLQPKPDQWQFHDTELKRYRQYGMKILGLLSTAPKWASMYPGFDVNGYFDRYYMPKDFDQFANDYVKVVVKRYANDIDTWDIWNEPWGTWWSVGYDKSRQGVDGYIQAPDEVKQYAVFQQVVYKAVKKVNPNAHVTGTNSIFGQVGQQWTRGMVEHGATPFADSFAYHHYTQSYTGYPVDVVHRGLEDQIALFPGKNLPYPAWMTEGSPVGGQIANGMYRVTLPDFNKEDVIKTSDSMSRYCLSMLTAKIEKFFLYSMHCHEYFKQANGWQVLVTEEGALHPSADAVSALAYFLEDTTYNQHTEPVPGLHAWQFAGKRRKVTVLSTAPGTIPDYRLPDSQTSTYYDLFGNPLKPGTPVGATLIYSVQQSNSH